MRLILIPLIVVVCMKASALDYELIMKADVNYDYHISMNEILIAFNNGYDKDDLMVLYSFAKNNTSFKKTVKWYQIYRELKAMNVGKIYLFDEEYYLANPYATRILVQQNMKRMPYIYPYYDCDDFTFYAMGIVHSKYLPAGTATFYAVVDIDTPFGVKRHTVLLMKAIDGKWYYYDPYKDCIISGDNIMFKPLYVFG